ncbi:hypothetical protein RJ639_029228 [Escallonia herrerae]|uniref:Uncharacterized protein n=1 Tax=Escallonia herrerae TaxID=1293975 RepID=A0AA88X510_9ASTE|nr:hypothetical protein RJ639_029228 [Escallonia herrerae]
MHGYNESMHGYFPNNPAYSNIIDDQVADFFNEENVHACSIIMEDRKSVQYNFINNGYQQPSSLNSPFDYLKKDIQPSYHLVNLVRPFLCPLKLKTEPQDINHGSDPSKFIHAVPEYNLGRTLDNTGAHTI